MSETVDFLNLLLGIAIKCNLRQLRKIDQYYNHYYEKFPEAIKLKCGYDLDYIIKYVLFKKWMTDQLLAQIVIKNEIMLIGKQLQLRIQTTKELNLGLKATKNMF